MKISYIFKLLLISFLFFSFFISFSQTKPRVKFKHKVKSFHKIDNIPTDTSAIENSYSSTVSDDYVVWTDFRKCSVLDRKGKTLFVIPGNLITFFHHNEKIATHEGFHLVLLNKDLDVLKKVKSDMHHELTVDDNDNIMLLSSEYHKINNVNLRFDEIFCYDSTGTELYKWSTYEQSRYIMNFMMKDTNIFRYKTKGSSDPDSIFFNIAPTLIYTEGDGIVIRELFHMNSIQEIPKNESEKKDSIFRQGNILLSFCNNNDSLMSFIAIVDPVNFKILWYYVQKGRRRMHTPAMLPNGHILVYVNSNGNYDTPPLIDEIDPITKKIVWSYTEEFIQPFRCIAFGSCQRLPNGNTFISNCNGYIYEVTPDKKIVWSMYISNSIGSMYRAFLYPKEKINWLINEE